MITSSFFRKGVTRLLAGLNIILNPATGRGEVEVNSTGGGGGGAVDQVIDGTNTTVSPPTGIGIVSIDADPASNANSGVVPMLTATDGAVPVDTGLGSLVNRRLTQDDIDPAFAITSFARSGYSSPKELGDSIVDPRYTASYNATLTTPLNLLDGTNTDPINLAASTSFGYNNFNGSGLPARSYVSSTINGTVTHTLSAKKSPSGPIKTAAIVDQWQPRVFYGITTVPGAYDEAFIEGLVSSRLQSGRGGVYVFAAGTPTTKIYICYPTAFGSPASIKDQNGFDFPMTAVATGVAVTNAFAVLVAGGYTVLESDNFITAAFTLTVT